MKRIMYISALLFGLFLVVGCKQATAYSTQLNAEKKLMNEYIKRNDLQIVDTLPSVDAFMQNPKLYYAVQGYDRFYYHLDQMGDSVIVMNDTTYEIEPVRRGDIIVMRYKQFTLTQISDTADYWTTLNAAYPTEFRYMVDNSTCRAWHVAVQLMQYSNSECTILVPSKLGDERAQNSVTPYGYKMRMLIKR